MAERRCAVDLSRESVQPQPVAMVCLDLDGTLFNRSKQIGQLSRRQIQRCLDQGIEVAVVSGRAFQFAYKTAQLIDPRVAVIGFVGAYRHFRGQSEGEAIPQGAGIVRAPCTAPAAPPSDCSSATLTIVSKMFFRP